MAAALGPLCSRVAAMCRQLDLGVPQLNEQIAQLVLALHGPLRLAFAGRLSTGKSTLVNALLRAPVAPTGGIETTKIVTTFAAGEYEAVELRLRDGAVRQAFLTTNGVLPQAYPEAAESVREIRVWLPYAPLLRTVTIVDTPGLESLNAEASARTQESLFSVDSRESIAAADALVYLLRTDSRSDAAAVQAFGELSGADFCALNSVGVLNCKTEHPLAEQRRVALRLRSEAVFRNRLVDVIPVFGLLAFAAQAAVLTGYDLASLKLLAAIGGADLLLDVDGFFEAQSDVPRDERQRLLDLLGFNGVRIALSISENQAVSVENLNEALLAESGLPRLLAVIDGAFSRCADQIKAGQTLAAVRRLSYRADGDSGHSARIALEALQADPGMHGVQEIWALQQCSLPDADIAEWVCADLARVAAGASPAAKLGLDDGATTAEILAAALDGAEAAHSYAVGQGLTSLAARAAEILRRSYTNIYREIRQTSARN